MKVAYNKRNKNGIFSMLGEILIMSIFLSGMRDTIDIVPTLVVTDILFILSRN